MFLIRVLIIICWSRRVHRVASAITQYYFSVKLFVSCIIPYATCTEVFILSSTIHYVIHVSWTPKRFMFLLSRTRTRSSGITSALLRLLIGITTFSTIFFILCSNKSFLSLLTSTPVQLFSLPWILWSLRVRSSKVLFSIFFL